MLLSFFYRTIVSRPHPRLIKRQGTIFRLCNTLFTDIYLNAFRYTQFCSPHILKTIFEKRLVALINGVRKDIPFYRENFHLVKNLRDFEILPIMTKEKIKEEFERKAIINRENINFAVKRGTSGSTGIPLSLFLDANARSRRIAQYRLMLESMGKTRDDQVLLLMPIPDGFIEQECIFFKCDSMEDVEGKFDEICSLLRKEATIIQSRPSFMVRLAQLIESAGEKVKCRAVISYSEELTEEVRQYLKQAYQAPVYNYYASNEVNLIGYECNAHDGVHVNNCWTYVEVVDSRGKTLPPGKIGDIIVTSLDNEVMPFIRYQTGDRGCWIREMCRCGRTLPRIKFEGRRFGAFFLPNGRVGYAWKLLKPITVRVSKIMKYQAIRYTRFKYEIKVIPNRNFLPEDRIDIESKIRNYLGREAEISFNFSGTIEATPGGKQQPFINHNPDFPVLKSASSAKEM